ncbi:hypothetical protein [Nostoc sp. FACHB-110]|uniref:hypothetical protein n=1 Tax=Nostoc sp. FACHB-110 TaxID=2692834 RepID=UPI001689153B|nr:hypothetical protein [Nostoc sp. FACHB-110]MBD2437333.1 hypothetical protein [Nostoc sp. FACHB-110]
MSKTFQVGAGNKVKLYVALLPLGDRTEPVDVEVTASSGITNNATSVTVAALDGPIAGGTPLTFDNGTAELTVYLTADAKEGDTTLHIEAAHAALTGSSTAEYVAKKRLLGGTQLNANINSDRTDVLVFEDPLGYKDGAITGQSWELPWTANLLSSDEAFRRIFYAAANGVSGREVYVWQEDPAPAGATTGDGLKGAAVVMNMNKNLASQGIITFSCTFMGQGSPTITRYAA